MQRRTRAERLALLDEFAGSGLTQEAFAASRGLNVGTFRGWLYARRRQETPAAVEPRFVEVMVPQNSSNFAVRISIGDRVSIEFSDLPPAGYLAEFAGLNS